MNRGIKFFFFGIVLLSSSALYPSSPAVDLNGCKNKDGKWTSFQQLGFPQRFDCAKLDLKKCDTDPYCINVSGTKKIKATSQECQNAKIGQAYLDKYLNSTYQDQAPYRTKYSGAQLLEQYIKDNGNTQDKANAQKITQDAWKYAYIRSFPGCSLDGICQGNYFQNTNLAQHACNHEGLEFATRHIPASGPVTGRMF